MKPITIVGAGLAGLTLGNALASKGIPTTIHEAGTLPRHRVCGEFISGRGANVLQKLGLSDTINSAVTHREVHWQRNGRIVLKSELPEQAFGISRHLLDQRLAEKFTSQGGTLIQRSRIKTFESEVGWISCAGRKASGTDWIGLKLHVQNLQTTTDLELHLGDQGYVGLSKVEDDKVNICGLFRKRAGLKAKREDLLKTYLNACGLTQVSERLDHSSIDPESHVGVSGISFEKPQMDAPASPRLGDALSMIPPFTGNGMSIALESSEIAQHVLLNYAQGLIEWPQAVAQIHATCMKHFKTRFRTARILHPLLCSPHGQKSIGYLAQAHLLPFRLLYRLTH